MSKTVRIMLATLLVSVLTLVLGMGCSSSPSSDLGIVNEAWEIIFRDYVDGDSLDANALQQGAIRGMVKALDDPYTAYLDPDICKFSMSNLQGKFEGIGAHVAVKDEQVIIVAPIPGSPAAKAGIRAGDKILEVDGKSTAELSLAEVVLLVRGPKGTPVNLLVLHEGDTEPEEIEIIRAEIKLESVHFEMKGDIAYINITHFSARTNEELDPVLDSAVKRGATGIILDLRRNPGGLLTAVVDVVSHFLKEGVVTTMVDNQGEQTILSVKPQKTTTDLPIVVLVDSFSASGSEVLSGTLQDYHRATIAGSKTFGKGSVDILRHLSDGSGLYITTGRWLTPDGHLIEGKGIEPDYELELEGEAAIQWAIDYLKSGKQVKLRDAVASG
ncbi:MAG: S41 family peptidase [Dehalococcoidales bacterium]|nr:S41 family peptidase [Dehalococcoidales bacterium]